MACKTSFELHHNFPKIAEEAGFTFNTHKPRVHINWNKIKLIDIENLIKDRNFVLVEQNLNDILDCVLESEFDVRILDEGVLKIFRLAQLAVEYQQFCRHYLDRSVFVLREEVANLLQDLDITKKTLREKEEENRKLRRKSKHSVRTPLPYGNENIATMILKTLNQNKGDLFTSTSQIDTYQYNKCSYCEKIFLNQLYLKSHISRRHSNVLEVPQKDTTAVEVNNEINSKLAEEIDELKKKLKQMEDSIAKTYKKYSNNNVINAVPLPDEIEERKINIDNECRRETKDAEVSTNEDGYILDKIEEWKKEGHETYNKELSLLRQQIVDIIHIKEKQDDTSYKNELKMMEQLHSTIQDQGKEISALKQELCNGESNEKEKRKEMEDQISFWIKRAEIQSNEHKSLLQKLNDVANVAQEFRVQAIAERERAKQLEQLLERKLNETSTTSPKYIEPINKQKVKKNFKERTKEPSNVLKNTRDEKVKPTIDIVTLKKLQQKAHALLNIDQTSSTESSSTSFNVQDKVITKDIEYESEHEANEETIKKYDQIKIEHNNIQTQDTFRNSAKVKVGPRSKINKEKKNPTKSKATKNATSKKGNGYVYVPGSPLKVIRAKITEQVNHRLVSLGIDPLHNRLPQNMFQKQRKILQEQQEYKSKKWPSRDKVLHCIMSRLDQDTSNTKFVERNDYIPTNKSLKTFSLSSVLSNVKTKALSLVKPNEETNKSNKSYDSVAKKAMALLKTPPGSSHSSPISSGRLSMMNSPEKKSTNVLKKKTKSEPKRSNKLKITHERHDNQSDFELHDEDDQSSKILKTVVRSPIRHALKDDINSRNSNKIQITKPNKKTVNSVIFHNDKTLLNKVINESEPDAIKITKSLLDNKGNSSDDIESIIDISPRKCLSEENLNNLKQTKGVLKNASSSSSLNKKKVLFDMDAIQMKSVSASPSQSMTEKSDNNETIVQDIVNLDTEEWDISSIENEPLRTIGNKNQIPSHTSPKIAELKQSIEFQLTKRNPSLSTSLVGGVDVLTKPMQKVTNFGGSNTSLGSSILDDTDSVPLQDQKTIIKPRTAFVKGKDDSEVEISDIINDRIGNTK